MPSVYQPSELPVVARRVHKLMMAVDSEWAWNRDGRLRRLTVEMVQTLLEQMWIQLTAPMRKMPAEEAENYAVGLIESGGIAVSLEEADHSGQHHMAVYVRAGTI